MSTPYEVATERLVAQIQQYAPSVKDPEAKILAVALVQDGWTRAEYIIRWPGDYYVGRQVEILDLTKGAWVRGAVSGGVAGTIQVDTELGPRTVGTPRNIRPVW